MLVKPISSKSHLGTKIACLTLSFFRWGDGKKDMKTFVNLILKTILYIHIQNITTEIDLKLLKKKSKNQLLFFLLFSTKQNQK